MQVNMVFLYTAVGALVGSIVGILLMSRKVRLPVTAADLTAMKKKLEAAETTLAAANTSADELRRQIAERDRKLQQNAEELKKKQQQLDQALNAAEKDKLQHSVNDQITQELSTQNASLLKARGDLEAKLADEQRIAAEAANQLVSLESQVESQKRQIEELSGRVDGLTAESAALSRFREQESRHRVSLEAQLAAEQERGQQLARQVAELESERAQLEVKLREERESAARGMELLQRAQENFSRALPGVNGEVRNGEIRHLMVVPPPTEDDSDQNIRAAVSAD